MNKLSDDILNDIYCMKHNLEYVSVLDELLQAKLNVRYHMTLQQSRFMCFIGQDNIKRLCLDLSALKVKPHQLLKTEYINQL